jgi:hypothetical protein
MASTKLTVRFEEMPAPKALQWEPDAKAIGQIRTNQQFIRDVCAKLPALCSHPDQNMLLAAIWHLTEKAGGRVIFRTRVHLDRGFRGGCLPVIGDIPGTMTWGRHNGESEVVVYWESHVGLMGYAPAAFDFKSLTFLTHEEAILVAKELGQALLRELTKLTVPPAGNGPA